MTTQPIRTGIAAATVAGAFALAGCGSGEDETATAETARSPEPTATPAETVTPAAEAAPATAPAPEALRGRRHRLIRTADLGAIALPVGAWRIDVRPRAMDVYAPRQRTRDFTMDLAADGSRLTIGPSPACTGPATYT